MDKIMGIMGITEHLSGSETTEEHNSYFFSAGEAGTNSRYIGFSLCGLKNVTQISQWLKTGGLENFWVDILVSIKFRAIIGYCVY